MTLPIPGITPEMSHERIFRDFWLPEIDGVNPERDRINLSILKEMYPRVWLYGPCVADWDTWVQALNRRLDNLLEPDDETLAKDLVDDFAGGFRWSSYYMLPQAVQENNPEWLNPTFQISRSPEIDNLKRRFLTPYAPVNGSDLEGAFASVAMFILTRYLSPLDGSDEASRKDLYATTLHRHNMFCERWGLPTLNPADAPKS